MPAISITVNGETISAEVEGRTLLVQLLRDTLKLTGTHIGCDTSQCGACVVLMNGKSVKACSVLAVQADGKEIVSIEGLADGDTLHPMQQAFKNNHGLQCGFCTPGMIMSGLDIVNRHGNELSEKLVRDELEGNICRCTGYQNIVKAIQEGASNMKSAS